jgi:hypothetical protein
MEPLQHTTMRQAALALHALCEVDRRWVLSSLSSGQRTELQPLLEELRAIGIPRDATLVEELCARGVATPAWETLSAPMAAMAPLDAGGAAALAALVKQEPPRVVAALTSAGTAQWRDRVLAELSPVTRAEVERQEASLTGAPALQAAILAGVRRRIAGGVATAASGAGVWRRVKARFAAKGSGR